MNGWGSAFLEQNKQKSGEAAAAAAAELARANGTGGNAGGPLQPAPKITFGRPTGKTLLLLVLQRARDSVSVSQSVGWQPSTPLSARQLVLLMVNCKVLYLSVFPNS